MSSYKGNCFKTKDGHYVSIMGFEVVGVHGVPASECPSITLTLDQLEHEVKRKQQCIALGFDWSGDTANGQGKCSGAAGPGPSDRPFGLSNVEILGIFGGILLLVIVIAVVVNQQTARKRKTARD